MVLAEVAAGWTALLEGLEVLALAEGAAAAVPAFQEWLEAMRRLWELKGA